MKIFDMTFRFRILSILLIQLFLNNSCSTTTNISKNELEKYDILNSIIENQKNPNIYYRTINTKYDKSNLSKYINQQFLDFPLCVNKSIESSKIFDKADFDYLKNKFKELKIIKIKKSLIKDKLAVTKIKGENERTFITFPIIFKNGNYAIYYSETKYGGEFSLLKKENEKWEKICSNLLWIE
jgi:hypothetical protein